MCRAERSEVTLSCLAVFRVANDDVVLNDLSLVIPSTTTFDEFNKCTPRRGAVPFFFVRNHNQLMITSPNLLKNDHLLTRAIPVELVPFSTSGLQDFRLQKGFQRLIFFQRTVLSPLVQRKFRNLEVPTSKTGKVLPE